MEGKVLGNPGVEDLGVLILTARDADTESQVVKLLVEVYLDDGAGGKHPLVDGRLPGVVLDLGAGGEEAAVDKGAVGGLVLNQDVVVLVYVDAEVDIADALQGVVGEDDIAPGGVATKGEAGSIVLDLGGKAQDDGVVAMAAGVGVEVFGIVLEVVVGLDDVGVILSYDEGRALEGEALNLLARRLGGGVEDAEDVGDVIVGEARVLLVFATRVEDSLGRYRGGSSQRWGSWEGAS